MLAILDIQHKGKPGRDDRGASVVVEGARIHETDLATAYVKRAAAILRDHGVDVVVLDAGWYSARHRRAADLARGVDGKVPYVACHVNAGIGDDPDRNYGLTIHDPRSSGGKSLAVELAKGLVELRSLPKGARPVSWDEGFPRAKSTIQGIYAGPGNLSGCCYEPFFIEATLDGSRARWVEMAGIALAYGCLQWMGIERHRVCA